MSKALHNYHVFLLHFQSLHGKTLELAVPVTQANAFLKRVRQLFDETVEEGKPVTSTYRSGINIKFGKAFDSFLGQSTERTDDTEVDWSKACFKISNFRRSE